MGGLGAFGKMPALGDFFRLDVGRGFAQVWDAWLQGALLAAAAALGPRWQDLYLRAPIWRFTLGAGSAGPDAALGVVMPSVDRVGRLFPLTLVAPLEGRPCPVVSHFANAALFAALEEVALDALEPSMTREALAGRLAALPGPAALRQGPVAQRGGMLLLRGAAQAPAADLLLADLLSRGYRTPSVWSAALPDGGRLAVAEGLPPAANAAALFDPQAQVWGAAMGGAGAGGAP